VVSSYGDYNRRLNGWYRYQIVIIGLPQVSQQLKANIEQAIWITQAYILANTLTLSIIGRLGDIFGRVKIYTYGFALFTVGSALTSIGTNLIDIIVFRGSKA
jgi:MFS family permease